MRNKKNFINNLITYAMVIAAFIILQSMLNAGAMGKQMKNLLIPTCCYIVMAVSLNLTVGISGELSLGHAGFMSIGCFSSIMFETWLCKGLGITDHTILLIAALLMGGIFAGVFGFLVGIPVLRLRGDYLAIVTLAFGEIIRGVINCVYVSIDGSHLHFSFNDPNLVGKMILTGPKGATGVTRISTFLSAFLLIIFTLFVVLNLINSRSGRAIIALRDNRIAAEAMGINATKYKMMAFVVSAFLAGMAGALYGLNYSQIQPSKFDFNTSILILVYVVLGGIGNIRGSVIAATLLYVLPELLREFSSYQMLIYAIILILVMLLTNNPIIKGWISIIRDKIGNKKAEKGGVAV